MRVCVCACVRVCVCACVRVVFAIYDNDISPKLIMIIIKTIILYFIQITHNDDFPSTGTQLVPLTLYKIGRRRPVTSVSSMTEAEVEALELAHKCDACSRTFPT